MNEATDYIRGFMGACRWCGIPVVRPRLFCAMCQTIREVEANAAADHFWTRKHPPQGWDHGS